MAVSMCTITCAASASWPLGSSSRTRSSMSLWNWQLQQMPTMAGSSAQNCPRVLCQSVPCTAQATLWHGLGRSPQHYQCKRIWLQSEFAGTPDQQSKTTRTNPHNIYITHIYTLNSNQTIRHANWDTTGPRANKRQPKSGANTNHTESNPSQ